MTFKRNLEEEYEELLSSYNVDLDTLAEAKEFWNAYRTFFTGEQPPDFPPEKLDKVRKLVEELPGDSLWTKDLPTDFNTVFEAIGRSIASASMKVVQASDVHVDALTRVFPTGSLNAQASPHPAGVLVLIDSGLVAFLLEFVVILLAYNGTRARLFRKATLREGLTTFGAVTAIGSLLTRYISLKGYTPSIGFDYFMDLGSDEPLLLVLLLGECLSFVVAHEHCHIALGHVGSTESVRQKRTPVGLVTLAEKRQEEEFEADLYAVLTLMMLSDKWQYFLPFQLASIYIFFCMDDLIDRLVKMLLAAKGVDPPILVDHPPAFERFDQIAGRFDQVLPGSEIFRIISALHGSFLEIRDESLELAMIGINSETTPVSYWETLQRIRERLS